MPRKKPAASKPTLPKVTSTGMNKEAQLDYIADQIATTVSTAHTKALVASIETLTETTRALTLLVGRALQTDVQAPQAPIAAPVVSTPTEERPTPVKAVRAPKVPKVPKVVEPEAPTAADVTAEVLKKAAEHIAPTPAEQVKTIKPVKPGKTMADLLAVAQACVTKHGMPAAVQRLAPFKRVTEVPEGEIEATIERLSA